jgi:hypothetical protein
MRRSSPPLARSASLAWAALKPMSSRASAPMNINAVNQGQRSGRQRDRSRLVFPGPAPTAGPGNAGLCPAPDHGYAARGDGAGERWSPTRRATDSPAGFCRGRFSAGKRPLPGAVRQSCTAASMVNREQSGHWGIRDYPLSQSERVSAGSRGPSRNRYAAGARGLAGPAWSASAPAVPSPLVTWAARPGGGPVSRKPPRRPGSGRWRRCRCGCGIRSSAR